MRRLVQHYEGRRFELAPLAAGRAGLARVTSLESNPELFPDLAAARVTMAMRVPRFSLTFPIATVAPASP